VGVCVCGFVMCGCVFVLVFNALVYVCVGL